MKQDDCTKTFVDLETTSFKSALEEALHQGVQEMLKKAIETEVAEYIQTHTNQKDSNGHQVVVRNDYLPEREIVTGIGPVKIKQPRAYSL